MVPTNEPEKEQQAAPPKEPTPDEQHAARLAEDHRGRAASMFDFITRTANPTEMQELCGALKPLFDKLTDRV